jgi:hypothetical protein
MAWITALLGAAGSIGGALASKPHNPGSPALIGIQSSPLFQQLLMQSLIGTGSPINAGTVRAGSPLATLLGAAQQIGLKRKGQVAFSSLMDNFYRQVQKGREAGLSAAEIARNIEATPWYNKTGHEGYRDGFLGNEEDIRGVMDPFGFFGKGGSPSARQKKRGVSVFNRLLSSSGYVGLEDFIQAQLDFEGQIAGRVNDANDASAATAAGRNDALRRIADLQSGFVSPTEEQLTARSAEMENILRAQIAREFDDRDKAALYHANAYGINPAGQMGRLGEGRALANLAAGPDALARTLQLLGGEQSLQANALTTLQGSLNAQDQLPLALLGLQSNNNVSLSNIASNQAMQLAALQSQYNQALGQGITGLANQLGSIPGLISEQNRAAQLSNRQANLNSGIDRLYGLSPGVTVTRGQTNPNDYGY